MASNTPSHTSAIGGPRSKGVASSLKESFTLSRKTVRTLDQKINFLPETESKPWNMGLKTLRESKERPVGEGGRVHFLMELPTPALSAMSMSPWTSIIFSEPHFPYLQGWVWKSQDGWESWMREGVCSTSPAPGTGICLALRASQHVPLRLPDLCTHSPPHTHFPLTDSPFLPPSKLPTSHFFLPHQIFPTYRKGMTKKWFGLFRWLVPMLLWRIRIWGWKN